MTKKWTAPWVIKSYQGNYYVSPRLLLDDSKGTACVGIDLDKNLAQVHPDDVKCIKEWYDVPEGSLQIELEIHKSFPSLGARKLQQTLDTIDFVSKYNSDLGDYISKVNDLK